MASVNKVIIVGNVGNDPEIRRFDNGGMIANVSIATNERWNDRNTGEQREHTEWHRVVFNNRLAEIVEQYVRRGSSLYIEGSLRTRKWQDQNGQDRYSTEIRADNMQMLGGRGQSGSGDNGGYASQGVGYNNPAYSQGHQNTGMRSGQANNHGNFSNQNQPQHNFNPQVNAPKTPAPSQSAQGNAMPQNNQFAQPASNQGGTPSDDDMPF